MRRDPPALILILIVCACLAPPASASGAAPRASVRGPEAVAAGGLILLDARSSASDRPIKWKLDGPPDVPIVVTTPQDGPPGSLAIVFAATARGRYAFTAIARGVPDGETDLDADAAVWVVTVGEGPPPAPSPTPQPTPQPTPPPQPAPTPPPAPPPQVGHLHVTYVADAARLTADQAAMRRPGLLSGLDVSYRWYQSDEVELQRLGLIGPARQVGLPCAVIQDASGKILGIQANATPEGLDATVRDMRKGATR